MASINHLLNQTIAIYNSSGTRDKQGRIALGSGTTVKARFERTNKTIATPDREREPIDGIVFVKSSESVAVGAKITYDGNNYRVMAKNTVVGQNGDANHFELMVQLWSYV